MGQSPSTANRVGDGYAGGPPLLAKLAHRSIQREFPGWNPALDEVRSMRAALLGLRDTAEPLPLAAMKSGIALFLELKERFGRKHPETAAGIMAEPGQIAAGSMLQTQL